jgi:hypothetical protein
MIWPIRLPALLSAGLLLLGGCAGFNDFTGVRDPHAPKTVVADEEGGAVTVKHGDRLRVPLPTDPASGYEWRRVEPPTLIVVAEGPGDAEGITFTPVRSGEEKLRLEYRPLSGAGAAQRVVSYDITVPERGLVASMWAAMTAPFRRSK